MEYEKKQSRAVARCLECGDRISYGRKDKKFCSEDCKNRHHNHISQASRHMKRRVMAGLEKNYAILDEMVKSGVDNVRLIEVTAMGFNPNFVTSFRKLRSHTESCCFDICYIMTPSRLISISKIQNVCVTLHDFPEREELDEDS